MITYTNIQRHENIEFEDYLKLPGYSHSFLKREINGVAPVMDVTDNMRLGSLVDGILTEPHKANFTHELYPAAREIAAVTKATFGDFIQKFTKQLSFTADMMYQNFKMPTTGRLDFLLENQCVIDLKVTKSKDLKALINFMGYENQLWHYSKLANVKKAYLIIYSVPMRKAQLIGFDTSQDLNPFFATKILKLGDFIQP